MRADHVAFEVASLDAAIAFYTNRLGMRLLQRQEDPEHGEAFAFLALDGCNIELLQRLGAPVPPARQAQAPYTPHLAIAVDALEECVATLQARGVAIVRGPLDIPGQVRWLYIADPDGNIIEFVQWL